MPSLQTITLHNTQYEYCSWSQFGEDIFTLSQKILESGQKFDRIVALAKGGLTLSRSLVDYVKVEEVSSIQIEFYTGIDQTAKTPVITQSLPVSIRDERILIVDDVADSGETLELAIKYLQYHGAKSIQTATWFMKPKSKIKPDFFVKETTAWIIFPHEIRETIETLQKMWSEKGDSVEKIKEQLIDIGIPQNEVEFFLQKS